MAEKIRCFLVEPSGFAEDYLRRYASGKACSLHGIHDASIVTGRVPVELDENGKPKYDLALPPKNDPRWPAFCECGYVFEDSDTWQHNQHKLYRPAPGNDGPYDISSAQWEWTRAKLPAGAMYYPSWLMEGRWHGKDGKPGYVCPTEGTVLAVVIPRNPDGTGTTEWIIDAYCSNCDRAGQVHHCWCRHGTPPWVTVDKNPPPDGLGTCGAGAGSIWSRMPHGWHGFLRNGYLEQA